MPIDFSDMLDADDELVLHPRDIFFTLNRDPKFSFPRDIQTEVINRWYKARHNRDNVIKLNVGSGKTLVGLLILQSSLNERKGPGLYVSPDNQLAQQVIQEATALGIGITADPRDPDYIAGEKICVVNVYKLFNGKSVFGVGVGRINIGTVVIDDTHACLSTITNQFRITLRNTHDAYNGIIAALSEDLSGYNEARFLEIEAGDPQAHMEVPFWSSCIPSFCRRQITPKISRYTRCSISMLPNLSINGRIRSSGQLGRWWYSINPCRNNECVRRFTVFAFNQRSYPIRSPAAPSNDSTAIANALSNSRRSRRSGRDTCIDDSPSRSACP